MPYSVTFLEAVTDPNWHTNGSLATGMRVGFSFVDNPNRHGKNVVADFNKLRSGNEVKCGKNKEEAPTKIGHHFFRIGKKQKI
jgi:hypothetical protein